MSEPMTDRAQIEALIARVEAATGPDWALEADMATMFYGPAEGEIHAHYSLAARCYTSSLDAIIGLIEGELPGYEHGYFWNSCQGALAHVTDNENDHDHTGSTNREFNAVGESVPLALCLAFLKAKLAQDRP